MFNHDFTGQQQWAFAMALVLVWLSGPLAVVVASRNRLDSARRTRRFGIAALLVGAAALLMQLGPWAGLLDVGCGWLAIRWPKDHSAPPDGKVDDGPSSIHPSNWQPGNLVFVLGALMVCTLISLTLPRFIHGGVTGLAERIDVCGRTYAGPGYVYSMQQMQEFGAHPVAIAPAMWRNYEVWSARTSGWLGFCGTGVYVRTDTDVFRGYGLLGGP